MTLCIAITRGGFGLPWRFETPLAARLHPLVQYGDAILTDQLSTRDEYTLLELPRLVRISGAEFLAERLDARIAELRSAGRTNREIWGTLVAEQFVSDVWDALVQRASVPPEDPAVIMRMVRSDREWDMDNRRSRMAKEKVEGAEKAPKEKKEKAERTVAGHPLTAKLDFGVGKNEKGEEAAYHPEKNNPKRAGAAERFKKYSKGMTIQAALDAGMSAGNIAHDIEKGYIVVRGAAAKAA